MLSTDEPWKVKMREKKFETDIKNIPISQTLNPPSINVCI